MIQIRYRVTGALEDDKITVTEWTSLLQTVPGAGNVIFCFISFLPSQKLLANFVVVFVWVKFDSHLYVA